MDTCTYTENIQNKVMPTYRMKSVGYKEHKFWMFTNSWHNFADTDNMQNEINVYWEYVDWNLPDTGNTVCRIKLLYTNNMWNAWKFDISATSKRKSKSV
jgi:hypothetical protein